MHIYIARSFSIHSISLSFISESADHKLIYLFSSTTSNCPHTSGCDKRCNICPLSVSVYSLSAHCNCSIVNLSSWRPVYLQSSSSYHLAKPSPCICPYYFTYVHRGYSAVSYPTLDRLLLDCSATISTHDCSVCSSCKSLHMPYI